jgi:multiple sugar transport system permease protein
MGVFLLVFRFYPLFEAINLSFTNMSLVADTYQYIGIENYTSLINSSDFWQMAVVTSIFVAVSLGVQLIIGLGIALAIDYGKRKYLIGHLFTRTTILSAWIIPGIVIGIIWKVLMIEARYGVLNYFWLEIGGGNVISFLSDPQLALLSVIVANTWRGTAFTMILQYGALQQVPERLKEASRIDGANTVQRFWHVTIPQIKPVLFINIVLGTIYTLNTFDMILALTGGGPGRATEVLALFMYLEAFSRFHVGKAAAIAVLMLLVNVVMTIIYMRVFLNEEGV